MSDDLLPYYNRELAFIRRLGKEFGAANPRIAAGLNLEAGSAEDPHVSRLVESFAFLNARLRKKLDDDFPEITDALLEVLYPHYLRPFPSSAIVQFVAEPDLTAAYPVPAGTTVQTAPVQGEPCRFRTAFDTEVWPIEVVSARLSGRPLVAPAVPGADRATACLRLQLRCGAEDVTFAALAPERLRFYLHGQAQHAYGLHELLLNHTVQVAVAQAPNDPHPRVLGPHVVQPVGFAREEGLVPTPPRSFVGYRLLSEFFAFPEKFLFVDVTELGRRVFAEQGRIVELYFYLDKTSTDLEQNVTADTFRLGCTPMSNLFKQRADPIRLTQRADEYHVVPDARRPGALELYSIDKVTGVTPDGTSVEFLPFHSTRHSAREGGRRFWHAVRRASERTDGRVDRGTELYIAFVDLDFSPADVADWTVTLETTCLNRDLPSRLPFGGGEPALSMPDGAGPLNRIECLTPPTATLRQDLGNGARWKLISHLSLGHLSLDGAEALKEILRLYDVRDSSETRAVIDGLTRVSSRPATGRVPAASRDGICRGLEALLEFDAQQFHGGSVFLFASVLERFLGLYCSINSFVRTTATIRGKEGVLRRWPPRAGDQTLL